MAAIAVTPGPAHTYRVTVDEGGSRTVHDVIVTPAHLQRYAPGSSPERLIEASFEFLLAREPKESILGRFELPVIERYFPEYAATIASRCQPRDR